MMAPVIGAVAPREMMIVVEVDEMTIVEEEEVAMLVAVAMEQWVAPFHGGAATRASTSVSLSAGRPGLQNVAPRLCSEALTRWRVWMAPTRTRP